MEKEIEFVNGLVERYPRNPQQINRPFDADVEILKLPQGYLVCTVDAISEELSLKLFESLETIAWLSVTATLSDMAASATKPTSISCVVGFPEHFEKKEELKVFLKKAANAYAVSISEYRTFESTELMLSCSAAGWSERPPIQRKNLKPGDHLFLTGPIGWGNAVAFANLAIRGKNPALADQLDQKYRPRARLPETGTIQKFAKCAVDTSDGLLFTLDLLQQLNKVKIEIDYGATLFHPVARQVAEIVKINPWLFFASQCGEFELVIAVGEESVSDFLATSTFAPLHLGRVCEGDGIVLNFSGNSLSLNLGAIRDLLLRGSGGAQEYVKEMLIYAEQNHIT